MTAGHDVGHNNNYTAGAPDLHNMILQNQLMMQQMMFGNNYTIHTRAENHEISDNEEEGFFFSMVLIFSSAAFDLIPLSTTFANSSPILRPGVSSEQRKSFKDSKISESSMFRDLRESLFPSRDQRQRTKRSKPC
jgi:hypothetical protein